MRYKARVVRKAIIVRAMGGACYQCGESRLAALTLHHRDPAAKESKKLWDRPLTYRVWAEVWTCDLLCHNCHYVLHAEQQFDAKRQLIDESPLRIMNLSLSRKGS